MESGEKPDEIANAKLLQSSSVCTKSNPRKSRQANSRHRWSKGENTPRQGEASQRMERFPTKEGQANQEDIYTKIQWQTPSSRNSDHQRPHRTGNGQKRTLRQSGKPDLRQTVTALGQVEDVTMP